MPDGSVSPVVSTLIVAALPAGLVVAPPALRAQPGRLAGRRAGAATGRLQPATAVPPPCTGQAAVQGGRPGPTDHPVRP